ncbi:MAG: ATP-binding protein [Acidobacteriota bacterium]
MPEGSEEQRLTALQRYSLLDSPPEQTFDLVTALVARMLDVPHACIALVDRDRVWFKSAHGLVVRQVARDPGFCATLIDSNDELLHHEDARVSELSRDSPLTEGDNGIRFYAGVPLRTPEGHRIGTLCTFGPEPRGLDEGERRCLLGLAGLVMNEIEMRRARCELERTEAALRSSQSLQAVGMIAGGVAHDFNNLLAGILGNAGLLRQDLASDSSASELVADIEITAQRAAELARQVLASIGCEDGGPTKPVDLSALVAETCHVLAVSRHPRARVVMDLDDGLPAVLGHPTGLRQVVMNLLSNAFDVSEHAGAEVKVGTSLAPNGQVLLSVADDGPGMTEDQRAKIFEPFYSSKSGGRGLGLSIVARIVEQHDATITVESAPGRGTTFVVCLPISREAAVRDELGNELMPLELSKGQVLIVDDEPFIRRLAQRCLEKAGHQVLVAEDGSTALRLLEAPPDGLVAILLDWNMPGLDGEDVLNVLAKRGSTVPVVLSSGHTERDAVRWIGPGKVQSFLQKPYTPEQLVARIGEAISA